MKYGGRHYNLKIELVNERDRNYVESSARIRRVSRQILLERVVEVVLRDQMILSILDDDSRPMQLNGRRTRVPA